jgi:hypothetical protein
MAGTLTNLCSAMGAQGAEHKRQFKIALSEATEAAGAIELARIYRAFSVEEYGTLRQTLARLCACLRGLSK